ncbi:MAG: serine/threonine-protein kinase [Bacteroidales bacterium]|nr:serine/threonine-protein kinase [Bacteroidales bacterium]
MALTRLQGNREKELGLYYEYDPTDTPLGEGGMGKVYKGWLCNDTNSQRRAVAIKFLYDDLPTHVIARAKREASVQLRNDNLIEMIAFVETVGKDEIGQSVKRYHVVSEYLHGVTLDRLLEGDVCDHLGKVIPYAQELYNKYKNDPYKCAITIVRSLLSGLMALHDAGYIHRDIDPSNIMVTSDGTIKLIDFGIAKKVNGNNTKESSYTVDGQFIGKPKYAAPELVRGLLDSQNATTDLYSIGIILYQLLVGKAPFDGEMAEVLEMQLTKKVPLGVIKQKQIKEVIKKATQKKRAERYQSAAEFRVAVDKLAPLDYPAKTVDYKKIGIYIGSVALLAGAVVGGVKLIESIDFPPNNPNKEKIAEATEKEESEKKAVADGGNMIKDSYQRAVELLSQKESASEGFNMLKKLAEQKDYKSTFLLSRLYFESPHDAKVGKFSDSVRLFRKNLNIEANNSEAHRLLKQAVKINSEDYHSLFELGCDYKSKYRGAYPKPDSAYFYLNKARELANKAEDTEYQRAIVPRISNL